MALSGHARPCAECPLSRAKRTSHGLGTMSAKDPFRTLLLNRHTSPTDDGSIVYRCYSCSTEIVTPAPICSDLVSDEDRGS